MAILTLGSNISSLTAKRQLDRSGVSLAKSYERLSSGMRINGAADDAAGVAISSKLNLHARVYGQALRNVNDGISALNIAEGAVTQLSDILIRIKELAEGSSNGTLALSQRRSLDTEAKALTDEFNRILSSTKFNRNKLIDGTLQELGVQLGFGSGGRLSFDLGGGLERNVGAGNFTAAGDIAAVSGAIEAVDISTDFNGDGFADSVVAYDGGVEVMFGDGAGGVLSTQNLITGGTLNNVLVADVNGDGRPDIVSVAGDGGASDMFVVTGNGDGTFSAQTNYSFTGDWIVNGGNVSSTLIDLNGDSVLDVAALDAATGDIRMALNDGTGHFSYGGSIVAGGAVSSLRAADMNGDGHDDLIYGEGGSVKVRLGNGDATFGAAISRAISGSGALSIADFNHDGRPDIVSGSGGASVNVLLGNGNGTLQAAVQYSTLASFGATVGDFNGDGEADIASVGATGFSVLIGNGDGTFKAATSHSTPPNFSLSVGDLNSDGVADIALADVDAGTFYTFLADTTTSNTTQRYNLTTREEALNSLDLLEETIGRVREEIGALGAAQSRLASSLNTISQTRENYYAAYSRIVDVDVASETANLVVNQIRQQAAAAVMAQANQSPALMLRLLGS